MPGLAIILLAAVFSIAFAAGGASAPAPAAIHVFDRGSLHFSRLDNGLRVIVKEDHAAPLVAVSVVVRSGTRRETRLNNGISHFLEHMIFRAARSGGEDRLGGPIESVGGVVNAGTLRDFNSFRTVTASAHLDLALDALAHNVLQPKFDDEAVFAERLVLLREAQQLADQPEVAVWDRAFDLAYGDHPYALPIGGTRASLTGINGEVLAAFHRRWYTPDNASVVIVGDVDPSAASQAAARAFGSWRPLQAQDPAPIPPPPKLEERRELTERRDTPYATVFMGFLAPGIASPREVCATDLLLTVMGEGYTSRLARALLETKLADALSADFLTQEYPGLFGVRVNCPPDNVEQVRAAIDEQIRRLQQEPVAGDELARAKRVLTHSYVFANETFEDQASTLGFYEAIATYEFAATYLDQVNSLTPTELQAVARKYLEPRHSVWVAILPGAKGEGKPQVAGAGSAGAGMTGRAQEGAG
jgi:zinc protease